MIWLNNISFAFRACTRYMCFVQLTKSLTSCSLCTSNREGSSSDDHLLMFPLVFVVVTISIEKEFSEN